MLEDEWAPSLFVFTASWRQPEPGVSSQITVTAITVLTRFVQHAISHQSFADGQCAGNLNPTDSVTNTAASCTSLLFAALAAFFL
jgi:hypothetical protein